jgi:uncharacterized protein YndB with AHSA1/START domain
MAIENVMGATVRARIAAAPERLWPIVADPTRHPELAGSGEPQETKLLTEGPLKVGSQFESRQKVMGLIKYTSTSEVTACEEPRLLRWSLKNNADWEFRFEPADGGSRVIHAYRTNTRMPGPVRLLLSRLMRFRNGQNIRGMVGTLRNLARLAGAPEPTDIQVSQQPPALESGL